MSDDVVTVQKSLVNSMWREIKIAREKAKLVRQEAMFAEERLNIVIRQMIHAGVAPKSEDDDFS